MVAWCTQGDRHGARQIPAGALKGVQFMRTPNYVQGEQDWSSSPYGTALTV